ncbi:hypothetical protein [Desulfobacter sp. UBA2225]|jgi:hypothetical protein|uniref:hypothetical protein n=1 Tax=Desulfobacter sp. UBA2225 TaxID=1961413 RepID=UPI00257FC163|nr:hypothetical protein [Desulfobacter sp. UBA2225]
MTLGDSTGTQSTEGQADEGTVAAQQQTTETAPNVTEGQPQASQGITEQGPQDEDTFFDPKDIEDKPELKAAYKQMQSAWTKKMQSISTQKQKLEAYNEFERDPAGTIEKLAKQYGIKIQKDEQSRQEQPIDLNSWEPKSWGEVMDVFSKTVLEKISPTLNEVARESRESKRKSVESQLNDIDPTWHEFEDDMIVNLKTHPTLANDVEKLYRISVPQSKIESKAVQKALKKLNDKAHSSKVSGNSTTTQTQTEGPPGPGATFAEAVEWAKKDLERRGIRKPG